MPAGFQGRYSLGVFPPISKIPVTYLIVRRAVSAVPREKRVVHVGGIPPSDWQTTPCKRGGMKEDIRNLAFRGLTFLPMYAAAHLLGSPCNIVEASQLLFTLLAS